MARAGTGRSNSQRTNSYIGKGIVPPVGGAPILQTLTVAPATATVGAAFTGSVAGKTAGSTLTLTGAGAAGLSINGTTITGTPTTAGAVNVVETLAGATGSPKTNAARVTASVVAPVLATLALTAAAFSAGAAAGTVIGSITGKTAGSTITVTPDDGRLAVSSDGSQLLVGDPASSAGTINATLTETLAGATGSPKSTAVAVAVGATAVAGLDYFAANAATQPWYAGATQPNAAYDAVSNKTFIAWHTQDTVLGYRFTHVRAYNHTTGAWEKTYSAGSAAFVNDDDHPVPALCINSDGRIVIFHGSHNTNEYMAVSNNPRDVSAFRETTLSGKYTYPHPTLMPDGSMALFIRWNVSPGTAYGGVTYPTGAMILILHKITFVGSVATVGPAIVVGDMGDNSRWYMGDAFLRSDGLVHQINTKANYADDWRRSSYYVKWDLVAMTATNFDGTVTVSLPIQMADLDASFKVQTTGTDKTGNIPALRFDAAGRAHVIYNTGLPSGGGASADVTPQDVFHIIGTGGVFSAPVQVASMDHRYESCRITNQAAGKMGIYYPTAENSRGGNIAFKELAAGAAASAWSSETVIAQFDSTRFKLNEVSTVFNAHPDFRVAWGEIAQTSLNLDAPNHRVFAWGDGGLLRRAVSAVPAAPTGMLVFYDPSDASTLFSDLAGTIPAVLDGPVRCMRDKSGNGYDMFYDGTELVYLREEDGKRFLWAGSKFTSNSRMSTAVPVPVVSNGAFNVSMAYRASGMSGNFAVLLQSLSTVAAERVFSLSAPGGGIRGQSFTGTGVLSITPATAKLIAPASDALVTYRVEPGSRKLYRDGDATPLVSGSQATINTASNVLMMFGDNSAYNNFGSGLTGRLYGCVVRSGVIADAIKAADEAWLNTRMAA